MLEGEVVTQINKKKKHRKDKNNDYLFNHKKAKGRFSQLRKSLQWVTICV